ncbi:GNAT family N-acetyltransferase [Paenarthrobacter sp. CM16]|uniref:GNAT family N-acetyltransferase n=1 Tax=Paenarthrobacter sp. CM16 TaxID=2738447 RepID=UPI001555B5CC|nr:GNAT family N-acetyltransferase [Paenarthrobacter sp. CM16]NQD86745.1 GNAT family N-acetyltransferase [Paenarthrobacter sp. CM16]
MSFTIRPALPADVANILAVELDAGGISTTGSKRFAANMTAAIMDPVRLVLVAETQANVAADGGSGVVGWAKTHYWDHGDGPAPAGHYLGGVTVRPGFRRQGVAVELTRDRLQWVWERAESAWYVVNARNEASLALHARWGFREVARRPGFHTVRFDGGEGVLLQAARPLS